MNTQNAALDTVKNALVITVGEELLEGSVSDTNSSFIAEMLNTVGITPSKFITLPDKMDVIATEVFYAVQQFDLILMSGGLGPTFDDVTHEAIAHAFSLRLVEHPQAKAHLVSRLSERGVTVTENQLKQAMYPEGADIIINPYGTACPLKLAVGGSLIITLPGVPYEMKSLMDKEVLPYIRQNFRLKSYVYSSNLHFNGVTEAYIDDLILKAGVPEGVKVIINAGGGKITVKIRTKKAELALPLESALKSDKSYYASGGNAPAQVLMGRLFARNLTLSVAESCTGGLLAGEITAVAGSSQIFPGSICAYSDKTKEVFLEVDPDTIAAYGSVSEETALAMARGIMRVMQTDCSIAITGTAGPAGGTVHKPIGTVCIAAIYRRYEITRRFQFGGSRHEIRLRAVNAALHTMCEVLKEVFPTK